jgi:chemotaxis signal transduction protein
MDDLLREFLTEPNESLDVVDVELVRFEQDHDNTRILKGTRGESYGLVVDEMGEVLTPDASSLDPNPTNLDRSWAEISDGVHRLPGSLTVVLDVERVLGRLELFAA